MAGDTEAAAMVDQHREMLIARHTDPGAGLLHYSTAGALARRHPDKYEIIRAGRQRLIRRIPPRTSAVSVTIPAEVLHAIAAWATAGPDMDTVTITEEANGTYRAAQGDEYEEFPADRYPLF
jgi:hypothetical protein